MLKPAAQRIALHQRHGDDRRTKTGGMRILHAGAGLCISAHRRQIAVTDIGSEMAQIAAEVENAGCLRCTDKIAHAGQFRGSTGFSAARNPVMYFLDLRTQLISIAGTTLLIHVAPDDAVLGIVAQRNLPEPPLQQVLCSA